MATPTASAYPQWENDLLVALGVTPNATNLEFLNLWAQSEGTPANGNNPLAITDPGNKYPHSGVLATNGGDPVYAFPTEAIGVQATAAFLAAGYGSVISAMKGSDLGAMYQAINSSHWCYGCQGGHYPTTVYAALGGKAPATIFQGGANVPGGQQNPQGQKGYGCNNGSKGVGALGVSFGNACQLKALTGGLLIGLGGGVLLVGAVLIASYGLTHTGVGRAAKRLAPSPARQAAGAVATSSAPAPPELTEEEADYYEAEAASVEPGRRARYNRWRAEGFGDEPMGSGGPIRPEEVGVRAA